MSSKGFSKIFNSTSLLQEFKIRLIQKMSPICAYSKGSRSIRPTFQARTLFAHAWRRRGRRGSSETFWRATRRLSIGREMTDDADQPSPPPRQRKIIHVNVDASYASVFRSERAEATVVEARATPVRGPRRRRVGHRNPTRRPKRARSRLGSGLENRGGVRLCDEEMDMTRP
jgi:hypothetical protein